MYHGVYDHDKAALYIILVVSICLFICLSVCLLDITFESIDIGSSVSTGNMAQVCI